MARAARSTTIAAALRLARAGDTVGGHGRRLPRAPARRDGAGHDPRARARPILDGGGAHEVLTVRADDVTIRGLTIRNVGASYTEDRAGIRLDRVRGCVIADNRLLDTFFGIYAARSSDCVIPAT